MNGVSTTTRVKRVSRLVGALSIGLIGVSFLPGSVKAKDPVSEEFINGSGSGYAQIYRVGPTAGRLSLAPIFGLSLSDYLSTVGRGETKAADWAGLGVAECSLPRNTPSLKIASTQKGAEEGKSEAFIGSPGTGAGEMFVRATKAPLGESRFRLSVLDVPGLLEAKDSESRTVTGLVGHVRESRAISEIGSLTIADTIVLKGMKWESIQRTGDKKTVAGTFTIEGASIAGVPLPVPSDGDMATLVGPINTALAPTGFAISIPKFSGNAGQAEVTPLSLDIVNSPLGRQFLAPILEAAHPARKEITDLFLDLSKQLVDTGKIVTGPLNEGTRACTDDTRVPEVPDLSVGLLAADLTTGIASGSSQLHIELGGTRAFTEGETFDNPFGTPDLAPSAVSPARTEFTPGKPGTPAVPGTPGDEGVLTAAPQVPGTRTIPGDRGGVAVAVGLIGLAVAIGLAVGDWYRMRASRRAQLA
jgi:hypothetical protein